jgi:16S rRNA (cytosine1402-N4)-methyltransferase
MDATIVPKMLKHYPVLLKEIISVISPQHGGTFIDCTFGQGGYSKKILDFENTNVIALDRDKESEKIANQLKENFEDRFIFKNIKFSQLSNLKLKNENIRGVIFDLGYSYTQIKDPQKGLSFDNTGKLNMQLGLNSYSAEDVINKLDEKELEKIFKFFGDEKEAKFIARNIIKERSKNQIDTKSLVEIIKFIMRPKFFRHLEYL